MKLFVFYLSLKLSLGIIMAKETMSVDDNFVRKNVLSPPYMKIDGIENVFTCAVTCSSVTACNGFTHTKTTTTNCILFYYQSLNNLLKGQLSGSITVQYVKPIRDCSELPSDTPSGVYRIYPSRQSAALVYCEMKDAGGGWTVLQRRQDGSEDFYRYWAGYKNGFGDWENEFWLGNDKIHDIVSRKRYKVRFDLEDFDGVTAYAEYDNFTVDDDANMYGMEISGYTGTAGDAMLKGKVPFSTRDADNDQWHKSCAVEYKQSGWWFEECSNANINGMYRPGFNNHSTIHWRPWRDFQCLRKTRMMIKPI